MSRARFAYLLSIVITFIVVFGILSAFEIFLRFRGSYAPPENPIRSAQPNLYQADSIVGYKLRPSRETTFRYPETSTEDIPLTSNSDGFRGHREFGEPDSRRHVLVVGDSFAFGLGVHEEDRFTDQLERMEPRWRVDNLAMTGWGLDLMVRAIEEFAPKIRPDVLVLAIYTDDFRRLLPYYAGVGYGYSKFELSDSELKTVPFPYPSVFERLRVVQFVYQRIWSRNQNRYDLNEALLDRFLQDSAKIGFHPVVGFLPGREDTDEDKQRRSFLREWTTRHQLPYVDLTTSIHGADVKRVYITKNWHWNAEGHRIASEELHRVLVNLPAKPE